MFIKLIINCLIDSSIHIIIYIVYKVVYSVSVFIHGYRIRTPPLSMELKDLKQNLNTITFIII